MGRRKRREELEKKWWHFVNFMWNHLHTWLRVDDQGNIPLWNVLYGENHLPVVVWSCTLRTSQQLVVFYWWKPADQGSHLRWARKSVLLVALRRWTLLATAAAFPGTDSSLGRCSRFSQKMPYSASSPLVSKTYHFSRNQRHANDAIYVYVSPGQSRFINSTPTSSETVFQITPSHFTRRLVNRSKKESNKLYK